MTCAVCGREITSKLDLVEAKDGSNAKCCRACYDGIIGRLEAAGLRTTIMSCAGCGAPLGTGCDCRSNRLAITRGERAKARAEEGE